MAGQRRGETREQFLARNRDETRQRYASDPEYRRARLETSRAARAKRTPEEQRVARAGEAAKRRERDAADPGRRATTEMRRKVRVYNITAEEIVAMLAAGCGICGAMTNPSGKSLHIDHDHACCPGPGSCGQCVRGVLCYIDNVHFERFLDSPRVIAYLNRTPAGRRTLARSSI